MLFWSRRFHRWIIHWLKASKRFIVFWLAFSVGSWIKNSKMVQAHLRKRSWEPCEHIISGWHQKCMRSSIMFQNMCAVPEFHSDLPLSRHWRFSIVFLIFSATDSKWIFRNPPSFENVYWILYFIIIRVICKYQFDVLYSAFRILPTSDSWAWINSQEDFENAHYSALHALRCAACLAHTSYHPRFFWENANEICSIQIYGTCGYVFCSHCDTPKALICQKCRVNHVLCVKTWVVPFVLMRAHKRIHFGGYLMYISDINFLRSSANIIVNNKK